jgi:hypothetical protein
MTNIENAQSREQN